MMPASQAGRRPAPSHLCKQQQKQDQEELKKMGNHSMPSKTSTLRRTVAAGTIAGCSAVGLGALSTLAAPTASACFAFCGGSTHSSSSSTSSNNGVSVSVSQTDGNVKQSTGALSGNQLSVPIGLGLAPVNTTASTSISNVAAANGVGDTIAVVAFQLPVTSNVCTGGAGAGVGAPGTGGNVSCG
jgi:hypothetical protein